MEEAGLISVESVIEHLDRCHLAEKKLAVVVCGRSLGLRFLLSVRCALSLDDRVGDLGAWTVEFFINTLGHHVSEDGVLLLRRSDKDMPPHYDNSPSFVHSLF